MRSSWPFRIPSLFRHFFAEGALTQSFVPVYSQRMEAGDKEEELQDLLGRVMGTLGAAVALVSLAGVIFAPSVRVAVRAGLRAGGRGIV